MKRFDLRPVPHLPESNLPDTLYRYFGGKVWLREYIIGLIPDTKHWCEGFLGSGCVSMALPPIQTEIWNDIDPYLIEFWEKVRSDHETLARYTDFVVYSRYLFEKYLGDDPDELDELERAWRWWYLQHFSFSGDGRNFIGAPTMGGYYTQYMKHKAEALPVIYERIQNVYFESYNVLNLMGRLDDRFVVYYDPPYFKPGAAKVYQEMRWKKGKKEFDPKAFREKLEEVEHRWILSIDNLEFFSHDDWFYCPIERVNQFTRVRKPKTTDTEYLITNFDPNACDLLFDNFISNDQGDMSTWM